MKIIVTGAAGFIGSNLVKALNNMGHNEIIAVDNLTNGAKVNNLADCDILDFIDKHDFIDAISSASFLGRVDYIFHQGACSATTEQNGRYMMDNNYRYSCRLLNYARTEKIPMVYASSAAVYGAGQTFVEDRQYEVPLNIYGYSKFLFDEVVRRYMASGKQTAPVVGLRYFNVYGAREQHKGRMASVVLHNFEEYMAEGKVKLFAECQGYAAGEQLRDFVSVEDVVQVNLHFFNQSKVSGIFNCGTGMARSFNDLALSTINACRAHAGNKELSLLEAQSSGIIQYMPFPQDLAGRYQCYTEANLANLRNIAKYEREFLSLEQGVKRYISTLL